MNEKEGPANPDNKRRIRPDAAAGGLVPTRASFESSDTTGGDASKAETNDGLDATIGMAPTMGPDAEAAKPAAKAAQVAGTVSLSAPKSQATPAGQVIANRFVVKQMLGQGGMGRVYAVQDRQIEGRDVALKVLLPKYSKNEQFRKLFFQEVRAAQEFVSEYICQVRDTGETEDGNLFFTMDRIEGEALRALLDREKVLGARQALEITRQVLLGLNSGHEKGYVHRDIKPSNVMLAASVPKTDTNPYGVGVRLLDFGIAGLASKLDERSRAGTVMYMSPEQASGERLDPRSDLFAVGVLLFEMLSGHRPFDGSTTRALVQSVLETNLTARLGEIPNLSKQLRKLLERALQKDRSKRFQSATDFATEIAKSEAYKLPKEVPGWAYAGLGVLVLAAAAEGYKLNQLSGEFERVDAQWKGAQADRTAAVLAAEKPLRDDIKFKEEALSKLQNEFIARGTELAEAKAGLDTLKLAQDNKTTNSGQDASQSEDLSGQLQAERDARKNLETRFWALEQDAKKWEADARRLESERDKLQQEARPEALCASTFDEVCKLIKEDLGFQALSTLKEAQKKHGTFDKIGVDGGETVASLADAANRVYAYRQSVLLGTPVDRQNMVEAKKSLDKAGKGASTLAVEGARWVYLQLDGEELQDRPKLVRDLSEVLMQEVTKALASSQENDSADFSAIDLSTVSRDAKAIFAHKDHYACSNHLAKAAELLVDQLRQQAAPGKVLQYEKLLGFTTLPEFVLRLNQGQFTLDDARTADLQAFEFAQRWYADGAGTQTFEWKFARPPVPTAATKDWRQVMCLQWQLSQDSANFPIKKNRTQVHRLLEPNKKLNWARGVSQNDSRFEILIGTFDAEGMFPEGVEEKFEFKFNVDGALVVKDSPTTIVKLHAWGEGLSVVPFPPVVQEPAVPEALASAAELRKFRDYVKAHPLACLVVVDPKSLRTRWLSPEFGLVFDETPGKLKRELVFASDVQ